MTASLEELLALRRHYTTAVDAAGKRLDAAGAASSPVQAQNAAANVVLGYVALVQHYDREIANVAAEAKMGARVRTILEGPQPTPPLA